MRIGCAFLCAAMALAGSLHAADPESELALKEKLARKVTRDGFNLDTLDRALATVCRDYAIHYRIDHQAFADAGIDLNKPNVVLPPETDVPLAEILRKALDLASATYKIEKDTLVIVPRRP